MTDSNAKGRFQRTDLENMEAAWVAGLGTGTPDKLLMVRRQLDPRAAADMLVSGEVPLRSDKSYLELLALVYDDPSSALPEEKRVAAMKKAVTIYRSESNRFFDTYAYKDLLERLAEAGVHEYGLAVYTESGKRNTKYLLPAAEAGLPAAQYTMGARIVEEADRAVKQEYWEKALRLSRATQQWFEKADAQGFENAAEMVQANGTRISQLEPRVAANVASRDEDRARREAAVAERASAEPVTLSRDELQRAL